MSTSQNAAAGAEWEYLARRAAVMGDEEEGTDLLRELLSFHLDGSPYAIPVERVREIVRLRDITIVPRMPAWVLGVVALRGEVVQIVDLRMRLGLGASEVSRRSRIIVLHGDDDSITGVLVDSVDQVLRVSEDVFRTASMSGETVAVAELCLQHGDFVSVIDVDRVLNLSAD